MGFLLYLQLSFIAVGITIIDSWEKMPVSGLFLYRICDIVMLIKEKI